MYLIPMKQLLVAIVDEEQNLKLDDCKPPRPREVLNLKFLDPFLHLCILPLSVIASTAGILFFPRNPSNKRKSKICPGAFVDHCQGKYKQNPLK